MPVVVPKIVGYEIMWICCMIIKQLHFIFHMIERDLKVKIKKKWKKKKEEEEEEEEEETNR